MKKHPDAPIKQATVELQKVLRTLDSDRDRMIAIEYVKRTLEQQMLAAGTTP